MNLIHRITVSLAAAALLLGTGCSSTTQRAGLALLGGAAGGAIGKVVDGSPLAIAGGAAAGAGLAVMAMGEDKTVKQAGFDQGYTQGQADAIKRQYWLRQALEREKNPDASTEEGERVYYEVPGPTLTADGKQLEPHKIFVPIVE